MLRWGTEHVFRVVGTLVPPSWVLAAEIALPASAPCGLRVGPLASKGSLRRLSQANPADGLPRRWWDVGVMRDVA